MTTAFVLGGGGVLGAVEVGMLRALFEAGIRPDLVVGTSVGAINGALVASDPNPGVAERLAQLWRDIAEGGQVYSDNPFHQVRRALKTRTHLQSSKPLRDFLLATFDDVQFEELPIPLEVCAASIERASEHWFNTGSVVDAVLASASVPGLLPPALIDGEHFLDGGIVNSIPVGRAVDCGATRIFVLQVGRVDQPLAAPRWPWQVAQVSFEIARRHRFHREMNELPTHIEAHVLPAGPWTGDPLLAYRDFSRAEQLMDAAYEASSHYLTLLEAEGGV